MLPLDGVTAAALTLTYIAHIDERTRTRLKIKPINLLVIFQTSFSNLCHVQVTAFFVYTRSIPPVSG